MLRSLKRPKLFTFVVAVLVVLSGFSTINWYGNIKTSTDLFYFSVIPIAVFVGLIHLKWPTFYLWVILSTSIISVMMYFIGIDLFYAYLDVGGKWDLYSYAKLVFAYLLVLLALVFVSYAAMVEK